MRVRDSKQTNELDCMAIVRVFIKRDDVQYLKVKTQTVIAKKYKTETKILSLKHKYFDDVP